MDLLNYSVYDFLCEQSLKRGCIINNTDFIKLTKVKDWLWVKYV